MLVLYNSNAGSAPGADVDALRTYRGVELVACENPDDTIAAAADAARTGHDVVVAAGGDGTIHLVANGLMEAGGSAEDRPALGVLPLGTGNDFARTLGLPLKQPVGAAVEALGHAPTRTLDLIRVSHPDGEGQTQYAVNACAGGFSGAVDEILTDDLKATWGPLAYLVGGVKALPALDGYRTHVTWGGGPAETVDAFNIVVANGRTAGGGRPVAPRASPEDGLLDVVLVRSGTGLDVARLLARAAAGDYLDDDGIVFDQVERVAVTSTPGMWFNVDGELRTNDPITFEVVPAALRVLVGPGYQAAPPEPGATSPV
ncbi:diacylglycerol/lipid kinase family protein [Rubrivirga litoralis]|uniref:Diacylglycerol kinase family lipid kinase n=1 Tax=Rubrivirga litoralis TaxID=3075598 RepID=A0ABU3BNU5_9BACT|nr:diacylglycerol kinase family lipid kinase [Rubrivirga sp. F394]MDT0630891.1 diacylglycerol kinase family lipid kinase [Rubrivirga sp. F394]